MSFRVFTSIFLIKVAWRRLDSGDEVEGRTNEQQPLIYHIFSFGIRVSSLRIVDTYLCGDGRGGCLTRLTDVRNTFFLSLSVRLNDGDNNNYYYWGQNRSTFEKWIFRLGEWHNGRIDNNYTMHAPGEFRLPWIGEGRDKRRQKSGQWSPIWKEFNLPVFGEWLNFWKPLKSGKDEDHKGFPGCCWPSMANRGFIVVSRARPWLALRLGS